MRKNTTNSKKQDTLNWNRKKHTTQMAESIFRLLSDENFTKAEMIKTSASLLGLITREFENSGN